MPNYLFPSMYYGSLYGNHSYMYCCHHQKCSVDGCGANALGTSRALVISAAFLSMVFNRHTLTASLHSWRLSLGVARLSYLGDGGEA